MRFSCFIKLLIAALVSSIVGYFILAAIDPQGVPAASLFATGMLLGALFGGILTALVHKPASATAEEPASSNIYVGNLPFNAGQDDVKNLFSPYGQVLDIRLVRDRRSKRFKGYGFVEMDSAGAKAAIEQLDGADYAGRTLRVNAAKRKGEE